MERGGEGGRESCEDGRASNAPSQPQFSRGAQGRSAPRRDPARMAASRAKVEITQEDLHAVIRKWQGEITRFACVGSYEDIVRKNVNFLKSVNERTARLSAKDLQKGLKEVLGEADPTSTAWAKMMVETLSWCNKRSGNKDLQRFPPAVQAVIHARGVEVVGSEQHSAASQTPPSSAKPRGSPGAASAASGGSASSVAERGAAILAIYGAKSPPRKRKGDEGMQIILSQETVASSPPSKRKAGAAFVLRFVVTNKKGRERERERGR